MEYPNLHELSTEPPHNQVSLDLGGVPDVGAGCCEPEQKRKGENRMKVQVFKSVVIFVTAITVDMVKTLLALRPQALVLIDENKNELFRASVGEPSLSKYGVTISDKKDIVIQMDKPITVEEVQKLYPQAFLHLPALEKQILAQYEEVKAQVGEVDFQVIASE